MTGAREGRTAGEIQSTCGGIDLGVSGEED
jgi:hypothetical protein